MTELGYRPPNPDACTKNESEVENSFCNYIFGVMNILEITLRLYLINFLYSLSSIDWT